MVGWTFGRSASLARHGPWCYPLAPMVPTWIVTCACGWVSAAETTEELMLLLDTHRTHASPGQLHTVTIKGQLAAPTNRRPVTGSRRRGLPWAPTAGPASPRPAGSSARSI